MSAPVSYVLRPAKNMERKMLCEASARIAQIAPLRHYRYLGFGGLSFLDFAAFHHRLGVTSMVSIERKEEDRKRFEFNRPYSCIKMKWGSSHAILPLLEWKRRAIVWLDYEDPLTSKILQDISLVASRVRSGSLLIVTVPVDPGGDPSDTAAPEKRLAKLRSRVGKTRVPVDVKPEHLAKWGTALVCRRIVNDEITNTLVDRSAALDEDQRLTYNQLFNFHYQDGCKMLTVGGIILDPRDVKRLRPTSFKDLKFIRTDEREYLIRFPILTTKETRRLDMRLPAAQLKKSPAWLPEADRLGYRDLYRYFPNYVEAEI